MHLDQALLQIGDIRSQMNRTRMFRGYRALTTLCTGVGAAVTAGLQAWLVPNPAASPMGFVNLWTELAITSVVLVAAEIVQSFRRTDSTLDRELTLKAVWQFAPCILVGGIVTYVLSYYARSQIRMLPGLWQILFAMGMFASRDLLPRTVTLVGAFYVATGATCLAAGPAFSFSPLAMGAAFTIGQLLAAACLHLGQEAKHAA